jgi:hypothetical protein
MRMRTGPRRPFSNANSQSSGILSHGARPRPDRDVHAGAFTHPHTADRDRIPDRNARPDGNDDADP